MPFIVGSIPYFRCLVRREFTRNLADRHGEYIPAVAYGVRCVRGHSLWFQCMLMEPMDGSPNNTGGASFLVPIQALCWKPCETASQAYSQPWDNFGPQFGVCEFDLVARGAVYALPEKVPGQYRFTIDFTGTDLADDVGQHKHLHICFLEPGWIAALPNNRVLWRDDAFWKLMDSKPDLQSLDWEYRSEGNNHCQYFPDTTESVSAPSPTPEDSAQTDFFANGNGADHETHDDTRFWSRPI